jgi:hypothetical protein
MRLVREFDFSGLDAVTLNYWMWYEIEEDWDYTYVVGTRIGSKGWAQGFGHGRGGARGIMDRARLRLGCAVTTIMRVKPCGGKVVPWLAALRGPPAGSSLASGQRIYSIT